MAATTESKLPAVDQSRDLAGSQWQGAGGAGQLTTMLDRVEHVEQTVGRISRLPTSHHWTSSVQMTLGWSLLGFTVVVMVLATGLLWRRNVSSVQVVRMFLLVLIVTISCFLVVVCYRDEQIVPVIGLFGAICGYLLGRDSRDDRPPAAAADRSPAPSQADDAPKSTEPSS